MIRALALAALLDAGCYLIPLDDGRGPEGSAVPVVVLDIDDAVEIAVGDGCACAVRQGGAVWCWGKNLHGNLGIGAIHAWRPVPVPGLDATKIATGIYHSCTLGDDGSVTCFGSTAIGDDTGVARATPLELAQPRPASAITVGGLHSCALAEGRAWCWGDNTWGQAGGASPPERLAPEAITGLDGLELIAAGGGHTCAASASEVWCWGLPAALGADDPGDVGSPRRVAGLAGAVTSLSAGGDHTCAIVDGEVVCWGIARDGDLGPGGEPDVAERAIPVAGLTGATALEVGAFHSCAVLAGGQVACWGAGRAGQLGDGAFDDHAEPSLVVGIDDAVQVAAGTASTCVRRRGGRVACFGRNVDAELGTGEPTIP